MCIIVKKPRGIHYKHLQGDCLVCISHCQHEGYPVVRKNERLYHINHIVYEQNYGKIPDGLFILHHCDVRACLNPKHLYAGTHQDNVNDMIRRGRDKCMSVCLKGEDHPFAKLTSREVREIKIKLRDGGRVSRIAREYRISQSCIGGIKNGSRWPHVLIA